MRLMPGGINIYLDMAKMEIVIDKVVQKFGLATQNSIYTAEALAVEKAIKLDISCYVYKYC